MVSRVSPSLLLRLGLAFVLIYAAVGSLRDPSLWLGYLPGFLRQLSLSSWLLKGFAVYELVLAAWLLSGRFVRYAGGLTALTLLGIIAAQPGELIITFRDVGLLFMALALAVPGKR